MSLYKITIVEIKDGQTSEVAMRANKPHLERDSIALKLFFQYPESEKKFTPGKKYAWRVTAVRNVFGEVEITQSKINKFRIGEAQ